MTHDPPTVCRVCGDDADESNSAVCNNCEERFHLRLRIDSDGQDCGQVWVNEQYLSLEYACDVCLGRPPGGAVPEPPVGRGH